MAGRMHLISQSLKMQVLGEGKMDYSCCYVCPLTCVVAITTASHHSEPAVDDCVRRRRWVRTRMQTSHGSLGALGNALLQTAFREAQLKRENATLQAQLAAARAGAAGAAEAVPDASTSNNVVGAEGCFLLYPNTDITPCVDTNRVCQRLELAAEPVQELWLPPLRSLSLSQPSPRRHHHHQSRPRQRHSQRWRHQQHQHQLQPLRHLCRRQKQAVPSVHRHPAALLVTARRLLRREARVVVAARQVTSESHPRAAQGVVEAVEARRSEERSDVLRPLNDNKGIINTSIECTCGEKQTVLHGCVLEEGVGVVAASV